MAVGKNNNAMGDDISTASAALTNMATTRSKPKGICFPCEPFSFCPGVVKGFLPGPWQRIQDGTHCMLVVGLMASIILVIVSANDIRMLASCFPATNFFCAREIISLFVAVTFAAYSFQTIQQYDEELIAKQNMIRKHKKELMSSYEGLLTDMDGLLSQATESASGLAERNFDNKRRDFMRFLEKSKTRFPPSAIYDLEVTVQFRRFCLNWLKVFQESSLDPVDWPRHLVDPEELDRCINVYEIAELCGERLRQTEVMFVSAERDTQQAQLSNRRRSLQHWDEVHSKAPQLALVDAASQLELEHAASSQDASSYQKRDQDDEEPKDDIKMTWLKCGGGVGCGRQAASTLDGYPVAYSCLCCQLDILSGSHRGLLIIFPVGLALLMFEVGLLIRTAASNTAATGGGGGTGNIFLFLFMMCVQLSLITVLFKFETIDIVQQLEREVKALEEQTTEVQKEREEVNQFWGQVNNLTELWLHRTVPRLDLYGEVTAKIEDVDPRELAGQLKNVNLGLESIEANLLPIQEWKGGGTMKLEDKKRFGAKLNNALKGLPDMDNLVDNIRMLGN